MASSAVKIEQVLADEKKELHKRRSIVGEPFTVPPDTDLDDVGAVHKEIDDSLAGVALSGGGVRAAAFSIGFLQAMYQTGRMKFVDYLSTVSGGGYAGALFSAEVARFNGKVNWNRGESSADYERLSIAREKDGRQPVRIKELALHGRMMGNMLRMLSRHLAGFLVTNIFVLSGVVFLASILAYVMKLAWTPSIYPYMAEMGFPSDLSIPFFPAFVAFWFWLTCQISSKVAKLRGKKPGPIVQQSYVLLLATVLLGVITFLAIGDINMGSVIEQFDLSLRVERQLNSVVSWMSTLR